MGYKIQRLQELIKLKVATVIQRDISDPRLGIITITKVELAKDLSECEVFFSVLGAEGDRSKNERLLQDSSGFIQSEVADILRTRRSPRIRFTYDESIEGSVRIAQKLREELGDAQEQDPGPGEEEIEDRD